MDDARRQQLRTTFEGVAEAYDRARPLYPPELFDDLVALAGLEPGDRIVEIGCGSGQATRPLAEHGLELTCVELGKRLAAIAIRRARFEKSAQLLRPGGIIAVTETTHVRPEGNDPFWDDVEEDYEAVDPSEENGPPPRPDEVKDLRVEIEASGLFRNVRVRRYTWDVTYSSAEYIAVLDTYSGHLSMPHEVRERLHELIRQRIDRRASQRVTKTYLAMLNVADRI